MRFHPESKPPFGGKGEGKKEEKDGALKILSEAIARSSLKLGSVFFRCSMRSREREEPEVL